MLLGSDNGALYVYDPHLFDNGNVSKFNITDGIRKRRKVEMVKWFEAYDEGVNPNKFIVVFDDGTMYVFFKDSLMASDKATKNVKPQG